MGIILDRNSECRQELPKRKAQRLSKNDDYKRNPIPQQLTALNKLYPFKAASFLCSKTKQKTDMNKALS
jgi:hypothetical protein